jgi:hypothetical protein
MRPFQLLARRARFEFPGLGVKSHCPLNLYKDPATGRAIALFFHTWESPAACGTPIFNAFENAATKLFREIGQPKKPMRFFVRVERDRLPVPVIRETYYCEVLYRFNTRNRAIEVIDFRHELEASEGHRLFGLR